MEQQLLTLLDSEENKKYYRYLLIDALTTVSEMDFIALNNIKELLGEDSITTVIRPDLSHDLDSCPKLITLAQPGQALEKRLLHFSVVQAQDECLSSKRYVCGWMVSEYPPEIIAEQMTNIGSFLSNYCGIKFIPFYEPFRMQLLHDGNAICPEFIADMLNCFQIYCYPNLENNLSYIKSLNDISEKIDLFITEEAKFSQQEAKKLFRLYVGLREIYSRIGKTMAQINLLNISTIYRKSWICGLHHLNDRFIFVFMTLRYGDLMSNQLIKLAINDAVVEPGSLAKRFKSLDENIFLSINKVNADEMI